MAEFLALPATARERNRKMTTYRVWQVMENMSYQEAGDIFYVRLELCKAIHVTIAQSGGGGEAPVSEATFTYRNVVTGYCLLGTNVFPEWWDEDHSASAHILKQTPTPQEIIASFTESQWETEYVYFINWERHKCRDITAYVLPREEETQTISGI
jgi:hypothetical protein